MSCRSAFGREKNNTMPGTSRTQQKAEARYNVTTQFPQYDLHFAAASGNLGLVEFALSHGQPINSVLNGVLPLHAACAGGSEVVVKYLIDEGADVNAPRIPRRYSNEKHKSSGLAVGASGSTPLHFAAANGHLGVVKLLLAHGAVPDRADKHGVTPEMLARGNGWVECADVLAAWSGGRSGDLPPVQQQYEEAAVSGDGSGSGSGCLFTRSGSVGAGGNDAGANANANLIISGNGEKDKEGFGSFGGGEGSKRLQMKRSIDNALHLFKSATPLLHHSGSHGQLRGPPSPTTASTPPINAIQPQLSQPHSSSSHSIFPLHPPHLHSQSQSHGGSGSPSPPGSHTHSHLHSLFHHHGHSHSTSQLQNQSQSFSQQSAFGGGVKSNPNAINPNSMPPHQQRPRDDSLSYPNAYPYSYSNFNSNSYSPSPLLSASPLDAGGTLPGGGYRRPSLPHIFHEPASPFQRRLSGRKRRPRSAGEDAEQNNPPSTATSNLAGSNSAVATPPPGSGPGTSGSRIGQGGGTGSGTITARKLSSKLSLRNLFRRTGGDSSASASAIATPNNAGSEAGSSTSASVSTSFSSSHHAPIYSLAFSSTSSNIQTGSNPIVGAGAGGGGASKKGMSSTPPASPLSASFGAGGTTGRPGSWYRSRMNSEGAGSVPVPRSPLVPSAVELHHRYSQEHLREEFEGQNPSQNQNQSHSQNQGHNQSENREGGVVSVAAPSLSTRPSILRGHNRSMSSQSSSGAGTPGGGAGLGSGSGSGSRTLRFDDASSLTASPSSSFNASAGLGFTASANGITANANPAASSPSPSPKNLSPSLSPETRWVGAMGAKSSIRLRGTRSASSLRHEHSYEYDDEDEDEDEDLEVEEEEEDYGTSINPTEVEMSGALYEDAVLDDTPPGDLPAPGDSKEDYDEYAAAGGRVRGASFASTASSSPGVGVAPESGDGRPPAYQNKEFPFSIERPPLTPISVTSTSESSVTPPYNASATPEQPDDDATAENLGSTTGPSGAGILQQKVVGTEQDDIDGRKNAERRERSESRARGESFSSIETDESVPSRTGNASCSSMSAITSITTPSPGADMRMTPVLAGEDMDMDNDESNSNTDVPRTIKGGAPISDKRATDAVYLHASPSSSLEELNSPDADIQEDDGSGDHRTSDANNNASAENARTKPLAPVTTLDLDLRGISNLAEAEALVRRAQQAILESAQLPADGPESPDVPLSAQLAAYGEILALERRFARGEKQREMWSTREDSDGEGAVGVGDPNRKPLSAKEMRMMLTQKRRDAVTTRQRGATTGTSGIGLNGSRSGSGLPQKSASKPPKHKRPHTAEGAPQASSWGVTRSSASPSTSMSGAEIAATMSAAGSPHHVHSHSRSTSSPLYLSKESDISIKLPDIAIIETTATPMDSPKTPESSARITSSSSPNASIAMGARDYTPYTRYTIDEARPSLPLRSRTPDPEMLASTDDFGVPLTRVATAPQQESGVKAGISGGGGLGGTGTSYSARGSSSILRSDPATRRTASAHKLSRMGFILDAAAKSHQGGRLHQHHHHHHSHSASPTPHHRNGHGRQREIQDAYSSGVSPASSAGSSRSPSKARFGGIKSIVKGLKGKS